MADVKGQDNFKAGMDAYLMDKQPGGVNLFNQANVKRQWRKVRLAQVLAVGHDVVFNAMKNVHTFYPGARLVDVGPLPGDVGRRQPPRGERSLRVIGDRHVLIAELQACKDHLINGVASIAPGAVHVEIAADICGANERRKITSIGGDNLVFALTKFRRNIRQPKMLVELLFRLRDESMRLRVEQTSFVEGESLALRAFLQLTYVRARSRIPDEGGPSLFGHRHTQRDDPPLVPNRDVRCRPREDSRDGGEACKRGQDFGVIRGGRHGEDCHVADGGRKAPQAPHRRQ